MEYDKPPGVEPEHTSNTPNDKDSARVEELKLASDRLKEEGAEADYRRTEKLRNTFNCGINGLLILVFLSLCVTWVIVLIHFLAPSNCHWIEKPALDTITATIFSGSFFAAFGLYLRDKIRS